MSQSAKEINWNARYRELLAMNRDIYQSGGERQAATMCAAHAAERIPDERDRAERRIIGAAEDEPCAVCFDSYYEAFNEWLSKSEQPSRRRC